MVLESELVLWSMIVGNEINSVLRDTLVFDMDHLAHHIEVFEQAIASCDNWSPGSPILSVISKKSRGPE